MKKRIHFSYITDILCHICINMANSIWIIDAKSSMPVYLITLFLVGCPEGLQSYSPYDKNNLKFTEPVD